MPTSPRAKSVDPAASHLQRSAAWAGLQAGDPVDVLDERERGAQWRFVAFVTNEATGATWVEVAGGRGGDVRRRSFRADQLYPHRSIRAGAATRAPLHDAPGLPF